MIVWDGSIIWITPMLAYKYYIYILDLLKLTVLAKTHMGFITIELSYGGDISCPHVSNHQQINGHFLQT